jgi:hypothetical protein
MWACIATAAGQAVAFLGLTLFGFMLAATPSEGPLPRGVAPLGLFSIMMFALGVGSCAVEDRVCEMAEREAVEP